MAARVTTVTHPDGTVSKRTSKTRTYAFAVVEGPIDPIKHADYLDRQADESDRTADGIEKALVDPQVKIKSRGFHARGVEDPDAGYQGKHTYHNFEIFLHGAYYSANWHSDSKGLVDVPTGHTYDIQPVAEAEDGRGHILPGREYIIAKANAALASQRQAAVNLRAQAAALRSGDTSSLRPQAFQYGVLRWSSREDLANKALDEFQYCIESGHTLTVVAVDQES